MWLATTSTMRYIPRLCRAEASDLRSSAVPYLGLSSWLPSSQSSEEFDVFL